MKSQCVRDIHKPARRVVEDAMLGIIEEDDHQLPNVRNLQRLANRVREDLRPAEPRDLDFIVGILRYMIVSISKMVNLIILINYGISIT